MFLSHKILPRLLSLSSSRPQSNQTLLILKLRKRQRGLQTVYSSLLSQATLVIRVFTFPLNNQQASRMSRSQGEAGSILLGDLRPVAMKTSCMVKEEHKGTQQLLTTTKGLLFRCSSNLCLKANHSRNKMWEASLAVVDLSSRCKWEGNPCRSL